MVQDGALKSWPTPARSYAYPDRPRKGGHSLQGCFATRGIGHDERRGFGSNPAAQRVATSKYHQVKNLRRPGLPHLNSRGKFAKCLIS